MTTTHLWTLQLLLQLLPDACQCFLRFRTTLSYVTGTVMVNITRMSYTKTACMMLGNFFPWCDFSDFCWLICSTEVTLCSCKRNIIYFILFYLFLFFWPGFTDVVNLICVLFFSISLFFCFSSSKYHTQRDEYTNRMSVSFAGWHHTPRNWLLAKSATVIATSCLLTMFNVWY